MGLYERDYIKQHRPDRLCNCVDCEQARLRLAKMDAEDEKQQIVESVEKQLQQSNVVAKSVIPVRTSLWNKFQYYLRDYWMGK
jgi:hypothetical protein